jgi:TonB-linked SusC/RagA family outer membrane protein
MKKKPQNHDPIKKSGFRKLFTEMKLILIIICLSVLQVNADVIKMVPSELVQQKKITGTVTDVEGKPLPGVTVIITGTVQGTTTNTEGKYSLEVPQEAKSLTFSFIGMESQEIMIGTQSQINIVMKQSAVGLDEVVVVGYGTQKKGSVTAAISEIKSADLVRSQAPDVTNSLSGRVAGIISIQRSAEPGDDASELLIRGRATLNDNGPLTMVDGIERAINQIDPNEIASLTVLKDASATAIYGTRGANGVILITTKKGSTGRPTFSYNGYSGFQNVINIPKYLNSYDFARLYNLAAQNDDPSLPADELPYTAEDLQKYQDHSDPYGHPDVNWWKEVVTPNALQQKHSLSVSGGTEDFKYFVSFGYLDQAGIYRTDNLKKYNTRINIDANLTKTTSVSIGVGGDIQNRLRPGTGDAKNDGGIFSLISYLPPNAFPVKNEDGTWASLWGANPVADVSSISGRRQTQPLNLQTNFTIDQKLDFITNGLSLKVVGSEDLGYSSYKDWYTPYLSYLNGEELNGDLLPSLYQGYDKYNNQTFETHLNYARSFNKHDISGLILYTQSSYTSSYINASRTDFASTALPQLFAGPRTNIDNYGGAAEGGREGYLGRFSYAYDKKYFVEASFGYNGSDNFPDGKRYGFFPAMALGWNLKGENFLKNVNFLSNLKLRASYGEVGNDRVGYRRFLYKSPVYFGDNYVFGGSSPSPAQTLYSGELANPNVTWERAKKTNIGVDADFFNSKLGARLDVFFETRDNILANRNASVPATFAAILPVENIGKVDNRGFEAELRYKNKLGELTYFVNVNYTFARNEIKFIDEPENIPAYQMRTGHPIGQFFGYVAEGLYKTDQQIAEHPKFEGVEPKLGQIMYKDVNNDSIINDLDITSIGRSDTPESIYGLSLGAEFKGFDINMLWQGAYGYNVMRNGESFSEFNYGGSALEYVKDNWTPENPNASYPRLSLSDWSYKQEASSFWLHDASYLRLKNLEVGYTFPKAFFSRTSITKLRIYVSGSNLLTFSKEKYFDPESSSGYPYYYPVTRLTSIGVNLIF